MAGGVTLDRPVQGWLGGRSFLGGAGDLGGRARGNGHLDSPDARVGDDPRSLTRQRRVGAVYPQGAGTEFLEDLMAAGHRGGLECGVVPEAWKVQVVYRRRESCRRGVGSRASGVDKLDVTMPGSATSQTQWHDGWHDQCPPFEAIALLGGFVPLHRVEGVVLFDRFGRFFLLNRLGGFRPLDWLYRSVRVDRIAPVVVFAVVDSFVEFG